MDQAVIFLFNLEPLFISFPPWGFLHDKQIFNATKVTISTQSMRICKMSKLFPALRAATGLGVKGGGESKQSFCLPSTREVSKVTFAALRLPAGKFKPIFSSLSRNDLPPFFDLALKRQRNEQADSKLKEWPRERRGEVLDRLKTIEAWRGFSTFDSVSIMLTEVVLSNKKKGLGWGQKEFIYHLYTLGPMRRFLWDTALPDPRCGCFSRRAHQFRREGHPQAHKACRLSKTHLGKRHID